VFTGRNNVMRVSPDARIGRLVAEFDCDNGLVSLGSSSGTRGRMLFWLKIGEDCSIEVGDTARSIAVNPVTHELYVLNGFSNTLSVISPAPWSVSTT
ncbi:hypothetical protein IAE22_34030, partial [Bacillus sp. S34]|nr:hypothetical protein [Bacillus sp. S34]